MKPYCRIIHPTDLSDHCHAAFVHALKIALSSLQVPCRTDLPVEALADFACEWKPQLTVMASQGRNDWKDRWLGSTLEQLLSHLHCPILVAPAWPS